MNARLDPYQVLGVSESADLHEVRTAFRRAALRCHPDVNPHRRGEAEAEFRVLFEAYQNVLGRLNSPAAWQNLDAEPLTPLELALRDTSWLVSGEGGRTCRIAQEPAPDRKSVKVQLATRDENRLFFWAWMLAILFTAVLDYVLVDACIAQEWLRRANPALLMLIPLLGYGLLILITVGAILLTRKTVYLVFMLCRKALPSSRTITLPAE
jgi:hypothetical protein